MQTEKANKERDLQTIVNFQIEMALESEDLKLDPEIVTQGVSNAFDDSSKGIYYVARTGGKTIASLLTMTEWSDWRNKDVIWIHSVYVSPEYRRKGIFSQMYRHLEKLVVSDENLAGLRLYVDKTNHSAIKTYQKLGMSDDHYQLYEWLKPSI